MQRRRFILDGLAESERYQFLSLFVGRFTQALSLQFRPAFGYQVAWDEVHSQWRISRGKFRGLNVSLAAKDATLNTWDLKFEAFFPVVHTYTEPIKRFINRWDNLPGPAKWISGHFLMALLLIPVMIFLPFLAAYRLVLLLLRADVLAAARQLDLVWPEMQASWAGSVRLVRQRSPVAAYFLGTTVATAATVACFWLAGSSGIVEGWSTALYVAGAILALLSLVLFIALILASLGFESGK